MLHQPSNIASNDNFPPFQLNMWSLPQPYTMAGWDSIANNEKPRVTFVSLLVIFTARLKDTGTESFETLQSASSCSFVQSLVPFSDSTKEKLKKAKNNRTVIYSPKLCVNNWRCRGRSFKTNRAVLGEFWAAFLLVVNFKAKTSGKFQCKVTQWSSWLSSSLHSVWRNPRKVRWPSANRSTR